MRLNPEPSLFRRMLPALVLLLFIAVLIVGTLWARREQETLATVQAQAATLQTELVQAQGSITAIAQTQADATATAQAQVNDPAVALKHALDLVFVAYQDPSDAHLQALNDVLGPDAASFEAEEAQHLVGSNTHLGGQSAYTVNVMNTSTGSDGSTASVETQEQWTYDEVNSSNTRVRCLVENSQQTYSLQRAPSGWIVESVELESSNRTDC